MPMSASDSEVLLQKQKMIEKLAAMIQTQEGRLTVREKPHRCPARPDRPHRDQAFRYPDRRKRLWPAVLRVATLADI